MNDQSFKCSFCQREKHEDCIQSGCVCRACLNLPCDACRAHKCWKCTRDDCLCVRERHAEEKCAGQWVKIGPAVYLRGSQENASGNVEPSNSCVPEKAFERSEVNELPSTPSARIDPFDMTAPSGTIGTEDRPLSPVPSPPPSAARHLPGASEDSSTGQSFSQSAELCEKVQLRQLCTALGLDNAGWLEAIMRVRALTQAEAEARAMRRELAFAVGLPIDASWDRVITNVRMLAEIAATRPPSDARDAITDAMKDELASMREDMLTLIEAIRVIAKRR